jgi:hypothetical protein
VYANGFVAQARVEASHSPLQLLPLLPASSTPQGLRAAAAAAAAAGLGLLLVLLQFRAHFLWGQISCATTCYRAGLSLRYTKLEEYRARAVADCTAAATTQRILNNSVYKTYSRCCHQELPQARAVNDLLVDLWAIASSMTPHRKRV